MTPIPFIDLDAQRRRLGDDLEAEILRVVRGGQYILGPEVELLERALSAFRGEGETVTCANGTDAIQLVAMAENIGPGDAVFMPSFTFAATAEAAALVGATPVFVDVREDTFNIAPELLPEAIRHAESLGLRPRMIIAVDLFGCPADYDSLSEIAAKNGLILVSDAAQSFGSTYHGRPTGSHAHYVTTSFFPAKPLGCYGDGGAVFTTSTDKTELLQSLRFHGKGQQKYHNVRVGLNSRLDTVQAAILLKKLSIFADEIRERNAIAARYSSELSSVVQTPAISPGLESVWAQYTIRTQDRAAIEQACRSEGIPTMVYYPLPLHLQPAYEHCPRHPGGLRVSEALAGQVLSLPMHAYLSEAVQKRIIEVVNRAVLANK